MNPTFDFPTRFREKMHELGTIDGIRGVLTSDDRIYPLDTDTKVLSKIFEFMIQPLILDVATEAGFTALQPRQQNYYPDFTLMRNEADTQKIAVDVKSTYRSFRPSGDWTAEFTLGSYTSFLRLPTKNIAFPYHQYVKHFIVGFIYTRVDSPENKVHHISERDSIVCPFRDVEWFFQEKHRIAGTRAGSGNTTNIGSIRGRSLSDFVDGRGPFADLGEEVFLDYWRNYGRTAAERPYSNLEQYHEWKQQAAI